MKTSKLVAIAAAAAIGLGSWWWASPYIALNGMRAAAKDKDADRLKSYVDFDKVRASMKTQFQARMLKTLGEARGSSIEQAGAGFGAMLGMSLADKLIDAVVSPQMIMAAMNEAKLPKPGAAAQPEEAKADPCMDWNLKRAGLDRAVVEISSKCKAKNSIAIVLDRSGFSTWKLTEIRLPD